MGHPWGVLPCLDGAGIARTRSLGRLARLPDELLLNISAQLGASDLARLSAVSRYCSAFANHEELWRSLAFEVLARGA